MGSLLCCFGSGVMCIGGQVCNNACGVCGKAAKNKAIFGRLMYAVLLVMMAFAAFVLNNVPFWTNNTSYLKWIPGFKNCAALHNVQPTSLPSTSQLDIGLPSISIPEQLCYGTMSVYRVSFALAVFHLLLAVVMIGTKSTKGIRHQIQHSWWSIKFLLLGGLVIASFFIPNSIFEPFGWVALIGAGIFVLIQVVLLVDLAYTINETLLGYYEDSGNRFWVVLLIGLTGSLYALSMTAMFIMYWFFTENPHDCWFNPMFIVLNLLFCFVFSIFSIYPKLKQANPNAGLLQSSVVTIYCTYLVWSALSSEPQSMNCNVFPLYADTIGGGFSIFIGVLFTFVAIVYSTFRISGSSKEMGVNMNNSSYRALLSAKETLNMEGGQTIKDKIPNVKESSDEDIDEDKDEVSDLVEKECDVPTYNYTFFHFTFFLASLYLAMVLTNWLNVTFGNEEINSVYVDKGMAAVWVKMIASWATVLIYIWTIIAPIFFPNRFN